MVRASSAGKICSTRLKSNAIEFSSAVEDLDAAAEKKKVKIEYTTSGLKTALLVPGLKTKLQAVIKQKEAKDKFILDPLPPGAMSYMKEVWLEKEGFINITNRIGNNATKKGNLCEDSAILLLSVIDNFVYTKEIDRVKSGFIGGTADIIIQSQSKVIDIKCPENWNSFKSKKELPSEYYWQLIAYCMLYKVTKAEIVYVLMPDPIEIQETYAKKLSEVNFKKYLDMNEKISNLPHLKRVKRFSIPESNIPEDIEFLKKRIKKCEKYFNSLNYKICMNL